MSLRLKKGGGYDEKDKKLFSPDAGFLLGNMFKDEYHVLFTNEDKYLYIYYTIIYRRNYPNFNKLINYFFNNSSDHGFSKISVITVLMK